MSNSIAAKTRRLVIVLTAGVLTACGNLTAGGVGEVTVTLTGDDPTAAHAAAFNAPGHTAAVEAESTSRALSPAASDHEDNDPEGELEAEFELFLESENGDLVSLTPEGEIRVRVDLEGVENPEIASQMVDAMRYVGLRMVFVEIEVEVDRGLIINGVPFVGPVRVELEGRLTVRRPLDLDIQVDDVVSLQIDLNAANWIGWTRRARSSSSRSSSFRVLARVVGRRPT